VTDGRYSVARHHARMRCERTWTTLWTTAEAVHLTTTAGLAPQQTDKIPPEHHPPDKIFLFLDKFSQNGSSSLQVGHYPIIISTIKLLNLEGGISTDDFSGKKCIA